MSILKRRPSGATIAIGLAVLSFFSPFLIPRAVLAFGFGFFFCWTALCVASVLADRLLVWAILSCSALLMVSVDWWLKGPPPINEYGYGPLDAIILFAATALVVGGTGALSVIRTAMGTQRSTR